MYKKLGKGHGPPAPFTDRALKRYDKTPSAEDVLYKIKALKLIDNCLPNMIERLEAAVKNEFDLDEREEAFIAGYLVGRGRLNRGEYNIDSKTGPNFRLKGRNPFDFEFSQLALQYVTGNSPVSNPPQTTIYGEEALRKCISFLAEYSHKFNYLLGIFEEDKKSIETVVSDYAQNPKVSTIQTDINLTDIKEASFCGGLLDSGTFNLTIMKQERTYLRPNYLLSTCRVVDADSTRVCKVLDSFDITYFHSEQNISVYNSESVRLFKEIVGFENTIRNSMILEYYVTEIGSPCCYEDNPKKFHDVFSTFTEHFAQSPKYSPADFPPKVEGEGPQA